MDIHFYGKSTEVEKRPHSNPAVNIIVGTFCAACFPIHLIIIVLLHDNTY